jgi:predicted dehydrogenase
VRIAIVGCGFVADYYLKTLANYPELELAGVFDRDSERTESFSKHHSVSTYRSFEEILEDKTVEIVLNLTNPKSHFDISLACLEANKHVYSEKPLSMDLAEAEKLVDIAEQKGLQISSAPCNLLGETAQTIWKALREEVIGKTYLVYAEMDDGLVHKMPYKYWLSESGRPWPYKDEFEVGCTLEHAGYYLTWLPAFFGRAESVTAFSSCLVKDKETEIPLDNNAPDFSVACIKFESGMVARLTCGIVAPHDHELRIFGDRGVLGTEDSWFYNSPVYIRKIFNIRRKSILNPIKQKYPLLGKKQTYRYKGAQQMDFARGVAELSNAIRENRLSRLSSRYSLHVNEIVLAIQNSLETSSTYLIKSTFDPIEPMPWAK